ESDPFRFLGGDDVECRLDFAVIVVRAAADAVPGTAIAGAGTLAAVIKRQNQRAVGEITTDAESVDCPHRLDAKTARAALIGKRAVDEAVGEHPLPLF